MIGRIISTNKAPQPIGPYSQAVAAGGLLFVSGQLPLDPLTGAVVEGDIEAQGARALDNVLAIVAAEGLTEKQIVKTTVYLANINDFPVFNRLYERKLGQCCPARSVVAVAGLPKNVLVEIEAVACL